MSSQAELNLIQAKQRLLGQYMTPAHVADQMCNQIQMPSSEWRVLDPACGDGNLLLAAIRKMKNSGVSDILSRIMGVDIDQEMVTNAKIRISKELRCSVEEVNVKQGNFLEFADEVLSPSSVLQGFRFNVVLSNPPYGRLLEYRFFETCASISTPGTEFVFLTPLAFIDRVKGIDYVPLDGRPLGVTTGHAICHYMSGNVFSIKSTRGAQTNQRKIRVLNGVKLYEEGGGIPPQTREILKEKPYSSEEQRKDWFPCVRTGDIQPFSIKLGRLWVDYGSHLAHPKSFQDFIGPRLFVRRMPIWGSRQLGAAYIEETALCAGDVLIVRHSDNDKVFLKGLCVYLNSSEVADFLLEKRPSLQHRMSYPKIAAKDLNTLFETHLPSDEVLYTLAPQCRQEVIFQS